MSTTSVTTTNIPKLTHDPSTYAGWRTAIEVALQLADSWNAALGLDAEPNRARWINRAPGATGTVLARNARAGSAMPEASETTSGNAMTADERKEWEKWQTRESKAQGMLKASVSLAIKLDLDDLKSAGDMWTHCEHLHALNIVENQREVRRKLYSLDLQDDATSEEMAAHVELFSRLIMEAKLVGIGCTSHERAAMFVGTILGPTFRPVIAEINAVEETKRDWPLVLSKYNAESARRKARPLARSTAPRGGAVLAAVGQPRISREAAEQGRKDRRPDMSKIECYECHNTGHYARDCWSKTKGGSNQPRSGQVSKNHHRGQRGAQRGRNTHTRNDDSKEEGRISLSKALFDEHESWAGLTVGSEPMQSWADMEDDGKELEPIKWPDEGAIEANPWADMAMFTQDSILIAGEPVQPTWVVDSGRRTISQLAESCFEAHASLRSQRCSGWRTGQHPTNNAHRNRRRAPVLGS